MLQRMDVLAGDRHGAPYLLFARPAFAPGRHSFAITADGYEPARCEVVVVADQAVEAKVALTKQ